MALGELDMADLNALLQRVGRSLSDFSDFNENICLSHYNALVSIEKFHNQFRKNMDYIYLVDLSKQGDLFGLDDSSQTCFCHD